MVRNTYIYPPAALDADHRRHHRATPRRTCRSSTRSRSPATTCRRPAATRSRNSPSRWPTAWNTSAPAIAARARRRRVRAAAVVLLRHRHELLHGSRQAPRRPHASGPKLMTREVRARRRPALAHAAHATARPPAVRLGLRAGPATTTSSRTALEALAGRPRRHAKSLHTNSFDEAHRPPDGDPPPRICPQHPARSSQRRGARHRRSSDPLGGSDYVEALTGADLAREGAQRSSPRSSSRSAA